jgi:hypothetical protein
MIPPNVPVRKLCAVPLDLPDTAQTSQIAWLGEHGLYAPHYSNGWMRTM